MSTDLIDAPEAESNIHMYPMTRDYVAGWGVQEGIREFLQNALDSESPFDWEYYPQTKQLHIISALTELPVKTLLLGCTSKRDDNATIGMHGEGYKIASLVLERCDKPVTIYNGHQIWEPFFMWSDIYGTEVFCIRTRVDAASVHDGLTVVINSIDRGEMGQIRANCLAMCTPEEVGERWSTKYGDILPKHEGKLYVNGLFVCDTEFKFGYNIKAEYMTLERDRKTIYSFELQGMTARMWVDSGRLMQVAELMADNIVDTRWCDMHMSDMLREACYEHFKKKHPGCIAVKTQEELTRLVEQGMTKVVYVGDTPYYKGVTQAGSYKAETPKIFAGEDPRAFVARWIEMNGRYMNRYGKKALTELKDTAQYWQLRG